MTAPTGVLIVHGFQGHRDKNWYPWMRENLAIRGIPTVCPDLPEPDLPDIAKHMHTLDTYRDTIGGSPILVGHSLGGASVLRYVEHARLRPARVVLVAPVAHGVASIANEEYPPEFYEYRDTAYDEAYLREAIDEVLLFLSHDDPYIDYEPTLAYYRELFGDKLTLREYENAGHFNANAGYTEFKDLLPYLLPS